MDEVRIGDLKARLSEHLRAVRRGRTLTVLDRDTPIARIVLKLNILDLLAEERQSHR